MGGPLLSPGQMQRYLMFLSYAGNEFRGMQKQNVCIVNGKLIAIDSVQQVLEETLQTVFKFWHDVKVYSSSRTDAGVHALRTSVHVQLQREFDMSPNTITLALNKYFVRNGIGVRIQSTHAVPETFSVRRNATSRTYLYRFAFLKHARATRDSKHILPVPFSEYGRTHFEQTNEINIDLMQEAANLLTGTKDLRSFMGRPTLQGKHISTIRSIYSATLRPSKPFMPEYDPNADLYHYWDFICHGQSFLYRQIRRTMGVLLAVGKGKMAVEDVKLLLDKPGIESWNPRAVCVPPHGLYLVDVSYSPLDIEPPSHQQQSSSDQHLSERRATYALY